MLEQVLERRLRVVDSPEQHEVRAARVGRVAERGELDDEAIALGADRVHRLEHERCVLQRGNSGRLRERGEVVRQADEAQSIHDRGVGGEVAQAGAREGERLAHGAGDDEARAARQQAQRARLALGQELGVGLVDDHDAARDGADRLDRVEADGRARRVVGGAEEDDVGVEPLDGRDDGGGAQAELVVALRRDPLGARARRDDRVHRVGGREAEHAATRAAEGLQQLLDDLVGAVRGPHLLALDTLAQIGGEVLAQRRELAVGVPVDGAQRVLDRGGHVRDDDLGNRVRVLVDVESDAHGLLRGSVGGLPAQVVADRKVVEARHSPIVDGRERRSARGGSLSLRSARER